MLLHGPTQSSWETIIRKKTAQVKPLPLQQTHRQPSCTSLHGLLGQSCHERSLNQMNTYVSTWIRSACHRGKKAYRIMPHPAIFSLRKQSANMSFEFPLSPVKIQSEINHQMPWKTATFDGAHQLRVIRRLLKIQTKMKVYNTFICTRELSQQANTTRSWNSI